MKPKSSSFLFQQLRVTGAILSTKMEGSIRNQARWIFYFMLIFFAFAWWILRGVEG